MRRRILPRALVWVASLLLASTASAGGGERPEPGAVAPPGAMRLDPHRHRIDGSLPKPAVAPDETREPGADAPPTGSRPGAPAGTPRDSAGPAPQAGPASDGTHPSDLRGSAPEKEQPEPTPASPSASKVPADARTPPPPPSSPDESREELLLEIESFL